MATDFNYADTITSGTPIAAAEVQGNFADLLSWIKTYFQQATDTTAEIAAAIDADALLLDGTNPMAADLAMGSNKITGLATPTAATDAATKAYVDAITPAYTWATGASSLWSLASGTVTATSPASYIRYTTTPTGGMWINFYLEISSLSGTGNLRLAIPASYTVPRQAVGYGEWFNNSPIQNWAMQCIIRSAGYIEFTYNDSGAASFLTNTNLGAGDQVYATIFIPEATAP